MSRILHLSHTIPPTCLQIKNAINSVCMAGSHFDAKRIEVFEILDHFRFGKQMSPLTEEQFVNDFSFLQDCKGAITHFLIMFFQSKTLSFKGIYAADPNTGTATICFICL